MFYFIFFTKLLFDSIGYVQFMTKGGLFMGKYMVSPFSVLKGSSRGYLILLPIAAVGFGISGITLIAALFIELSSSHKSAETTRAIEGALKQEQKFAKILVDSRLLFTPSSNPLVKDIQREECLLRKEIYSCTKGVIDNEKQGAEEIINCSLDPVKGQEGRLDKLEMQWGYIQEDAQSTSHVAEVDSRFREWQSITHSALDCLADLADNLDKSNFSPDFLAKRNAERCALPALEKQVRIINDVTPCSVSRR